MSKPITIRIPPNIIQHFKDKAKESGVGYQTLMKLALLDHIKKTPKNDTTLITP